MRKLALVSCIGGALLSLSATATLADTSAAEMIKVWKVEYSGRPPFKRQLIELPAADVARLEVSNEIVETERMWTVDYSDKPPFRRKFDDVPVIDAASLETEVTAGSSRKKPLGFFKRHR